MDNIKNDKLRVLETRREKYCAQKIDDFVSYCRFTLNENDLVSWEEVNWTSTLR